jgi:hypothetical protein
MERLQLRVTGKDPFRQTNLAWERPLKRLACSTRPWLAQSLSPKHAGEPPEPLRFLQMSVNVTAKPLR